MENVLELIDKNILDLKSVEIDQETVQFLNKFPENVSSLCTMDFIDIVTCFYLVNFDTSLIIAKQEVNKVSSFLEDLKMLEYENVLDLIDIFDDLDGKYGKKLGNKDYDDYMFMYEQDDQLEDVKTMLKAYLERYRKSEINEFLKWINNENLCKIMCLASALKLEIS